MARFRVGMLYYLIFEPEYVERKIGEIFEFGDEWYQCVEGRCKDCHFSEKRYLCKQFIVKNFCLSGIIFKKLEKVGEPYMLEDKKFQKYKVFKTPYIYHKIDCSWQSFADPYYISLEIKENMEEKKLIELLSEKVHNAWMKEKEAQGFSYGKDYDKEKKKHPDMLPYNELKEEVKEYDRATVRAVLQAQKELQSKYNYNNLKSFDLEAAKAGKPVCTRDGHKARIICFDRKGYNMFPIVALIMNGDRESDIYTYRPNGTWDNSGNESDKDLMMLPEKKEGWINIIKTEDGGYCCKGEVNSDYNDAFIENINVLDNRGITVKIEWEE